MYLYLLTLRKINMCKHIMADRVFYPEGNNNKLICMVLQPNILTFATKK